MNLIPSFQEFINEAKAFYTYTIFAPNTPTLKDYHKCLKELKDANFITNQISEYSCSLKISADLKDKFLNLAKKYSEKLKFNEKINSDKSKDVVFESLNGKIRVFKTTQMKDYIKDIKEEDIEERSEDKRIKDSSNGYLVNSVILKDGTKGFVWSKNQSLD